MNRLASAVLAGFCFIATAGAALAANDNAAAGAAAIPDTGAAARSAHDTAVGDRMTHALNLLEANGYGEFSNFRPAGKNFMATVTGNGQRFTVTIDPDSEQVTRQG